MTEPFRISAIRTDRSRMHTPIHTVAFGILTDNRRPNRTPRDTDYLLQSANQARPEPRWCRCSDETLPTHRRSAALMFARRQKDSKQGLWEALKNRPSQNKTLSYWREESYIFCLDRYAKSLAQGAPSHPQSSCSLRRYIHNAYWHCQLISLATFNDKYIHESV